MTFEQIKNALLWWSLLLLSCCVVLLSTCPTYPSFSMLVSDSLNLPLHITETFKEHLIFDCINSIIDLHFKINHLIFD